MMKEFKASCFLKAVIYFCHAYFFSKIPSYYRYILVGEKKSEDGFNTVILYQIVGEEGSFEITIDDLLGDPSVIEKFHPADAVKLGVIAGDFFFQLEQSTSKQQTYQEIKRKSFHPIDI